MVYAQLRTRGYYIPPLYCRQLLISDERGRIILTYTLGGGGSSPKTNNRVIVCQGNCHFGRKNQKRTEQIQGIIEMLKGMGQV
jgi:hypothetical protein